MITPNQCKYGSSGMCGRRSNIPFCPPRGVDEFPSMALFKREDVDGDEWCQLWPPPGIPLQFENLFDKELSFSLFLSCLPKEVNCPRFPLEAALLTGSLGQSRPSS